MVMVIRSPWLPCTSNVGYRNTCRNGNLRGSLMGVTFLQVMMPFIAPNQGLQSRSRFLNPGIRDWGISHPGILGSRREYRDLGIIDISVPNPGIEKTGTGLQALDYRCAIISTSRMRKINNFDCIFGNDYCNAVNRI